MSDRTAAEVKIELDQARAARVTAMSAQNYSLDSGQGRQQVTRASLKDLNETIRTLESEYAIAADNEAGGSGLLTMRFRRLG